MIMIKKEKSNKNKITLLLIALILLVVTIRMSNQNQQLKKEIGISYYNAIAGALYSPYSDLQYLLQEREEINHETLEIYATAFSHNHSSLSSYYPQTSKNVELHRYAWRVKRKTQDIIDAMKKGEYELIPNEEREELIALLQAGNKTFETLRETIEGNNTIFNNSRGIKWYNALHNPTEEVIKVIQEGLK